MQDSVTACEQSVMGVVISTINIMFYLEQERNEVIFMGSHTSNAVWHRFNAAPNMLVKDAMQHFVQWAKYFVGVYVGTHNKILITE